MALKPLPSVEFQLNSQQARCKDGRSPHPRKLATSPDSSGHKGTSWGFASAVFLPCYTVFPQPGTPTPSEPRERNGHTGRKGFPDTTAAYQ